MEFADRLTNPIFKNLTKAELDYLFQSAKTRVFEKREILIHEGDLDQEIYVIIDGQVDLSKASGLPEEIIPLTTLGAGSVIGEIAVITNNPRSATKKPLL